MIEINPARIPDYDYSPDDFLPGVCVCAEHASIDSPVVFCDVHERYTDDHFVVRPTEWWAVYDSPVQVAA
jgi:hypothetical protein